MYKNSHSPQQNISLLPSASMPTPQPPTISQSSMNMTPNTTNQNQYCHPLTVLYLQNNTMLSQLHGQTQSITLLKDTTKTLTSKLDNNHQQTLSILQKEKQELKETVVKMENEIKTKQSENDQLKEEKHALAMKLNSTEANLKIEKIQNKQLIENKTKDQSTIKTLQEKIIFSHQAGKNIQNRGNDFKIIAKSQHHFLQKLRAHFPNLTIPNFFPTQHRGRPNPMNTNRIIPKKRPLDTTNNNASGPQHISKKQRMNNTAVLSNHKISTNTLPRHVSLPPNYYNHQYSTHNTMNTSMMPNGIPMPHPSQQINILHSIPTRQNMNVNHNNSVSTMTTSNAQKQKDGISTTHLITNSTSNFYNYNSENNLSSSHQSNKTNNDDLSIFPPRI